MTRDIGSRMLSGCAWLDEIAHNSLTAGSVVLLMTEPRALDALLASVVSGTEVGRAARVGNHLEAVRLQCKDDDVRLIVCPDIGPMKRTPASETISMARVTAEVKRAIAIVPLGRDPRLWPVRHDTDVIVQTRVMKDRTVQACTTKNRHAANLSGWTATPVRVE